ncbi:MAG: hypothetical protein U1F67_24940 [Rubrivivax sp.]
MNLLNGQADGSRFTAGGQVLALPRGAAQLVALLPLGARPELRGDRPRRRLGADGGRAGDARR